MLCINFNHYGFVEYDKDFDIGNIPQLKELNDLKRCEIII